MADQLQEHTQGQALSPEIQIQSLREELDAANKRTDRYVHLVASLSEELDNLRRNICRLCKMEFVPFYATPVEALPSDGVGPRPSLWRRIFGGCQTQILSFVLPLVLPKRSFNTSITVQENQKNEHSAFLAPLQASPCAIARQGPTKPVVQPKQFGWGVSYNPKIKQAIHVDWGKTFECIAMVFCVKFSPDGKYLAVGLGSGSGKTYIYDIEKDLNICCFIDLHLKDQPMVWCIQFSPDSKYIATASDKQIRLWEIERKRMRAGFPARARPLCFSPNGRFLVVGEGSSVRILSLRDGSSKTLLDGNRSGTTSITFSPDGRHIASVDFGCWLRIWDARTGQLLDTWNGESRVGRCVAFSPDGRGLVSGAGDGILRYWDVSSLADMETGRDRVIGGIPGQRFQQLRKFEGHMSCVGSSSFSPDSRWVATSSWDQSVRIWDPHTAERQCTLHGHDGYARTVDFSPAGKYLASGGEDCRVMLWKYREV